MNTMNRLLAPVLLCCLAPALADDAPARYSHAIGLALSGQNALVQLRLPPAVYLHARSATLDDVRVVDGAGKALPFALLEPQPLAKVSTRALPAAIFPVYSESAQAARDTIEIRTSASGTVTSITPPSGAAPGRTLSALVLDFGAAAAGQAINALVFTPPPDAGNYEAQVALEVSNDLRSWDTLGYASLSWLSNSERQTLRSERMEFAPRAFRYGRLVWREGRPLPFSAITADAPVTLTEGAAFDSLSLRPRPGRFAHDLVYEAGPAIAPERIALSFGPGNVVMPATLGYYAAVPPPRGQTGTRWDFVPRLHATFYQFTQDGVQRRSSEIAAEGLHGPQWVLRSQAVPTPAPILKLSWRPATLVFMASGTAPYSLLVGRAQAPSVRRPIGQVAPGLTHTELAALELATPGAPRLQHPDATAQPTGAAPAGPKLALWGVLLLGVAVLAAMAWKLHRQMNQPG